MVINLLYVAIADVSSFVSHNGHIDKQAFQRATSVYFPGFVVPMLPHRLADDLCSLKPNVKRRTLACEINLTQGGEVESLEFYFAIIESKRYTYSEVDKILQEVVRGRQPEENSLINLQSVPSDVGAARRRGALDFATPMVSIDFDDQQQKPQSVVIAKRNIAHQMIEEAMLLANTAAARFLLSEYGGGIFATILSLIGKSLKP